MVRVPLRVPETVGVNVMLRTQLEPDGNCAGQLFFCAKSPVTWIPLIFNARFPLLVRVAVCDALEVPTRWLGNVKLVCVSAAPGPEPSPARLMRWGDPAASS